MEKNVWKQAGGGAYMPCSIFLRLSVLMKACMPLQKITTKYQYMCMKLFTLIFPRRYNPLFWTHKQTEAMTAAVTYNNTQCW